MTNIFNILYKIRKKKEKRKKKLSKEDATVILVS